MRTKNLIKCGLFTSLIIIGTFIKIPFPGMPMTLQFASILLAGIVLGPYWGALSVVLYAVLGLIGIPVFTSGGGIGYVLTPSFGYIIGFILAAFFVGLISRRRPGSVPILILGGLTALTVTYLVGILYFTMIKSIYLGETVDFRYVLYSQVLLMMPKDIVMCILCAFMGKKLQFIIAMDKFR